MHFQVLGQFTSDDWLCSRIQGEMVHGSTGTSVTLDVMIMGRVRDGKFVEAWNSADWVPGLTALGLLEENAIGKMVLAGLFILEKTRIYGRFGSQMTTKIWLILVGLQWQS